MRNMNIRDYASLLDDREQRAFEHFHTQNAYAQAVDLLIRTGHVNEAVSYGSSLKILDKVADIALQHGHYCIAEGLYRDVGNNTKLAEVIAAQGRHSEAAELLTRLQLFERAAQMYARNNEFDKAAALYARIQQFMNAAMCYQKSGNLPKQYEMQISAFRHDLYLADGDVTAVNVSRMLAIQAAMAFLADERTQQLGLRVLQETQYLNTAAQQLEEEGKLALAALCYEKNEQADKAAIAFEKAGNVCKAAAMFQARNDDAGELALFRRHQKYFSYGRKLFILKRFDEALDALKAIDSTDPTYAMAMELQGDIYSKQGKHEDATLCYESLMWTDLAKDDLCRVAYKAAHCYELQGNFDNAVKLYKRILDIDPNFHDVAARLQASAEKLRRKTPTQTDEDPKGPPTTTTTTAATRGVLRRATTSERRRPNSITIGTTEIPTIGNDRYNVIEEVAHGGMGLVYRATDTILMRTVALKVLSQKLKDNPVALEYFMREARASAQLQHVNIVTIFDIGSFQDGTVYLAMEFIDGKTLKQLITQTGPFPTKFLVQLTMHACRGLQYAHDNGIIHRDVKSSNMMLAKKDKTLKILDLGLAKVVNEHELGSTQAIGTPYYMSPEQVMGTEIDCRSDIYSLGVTLFELSTGTLPYLKGDIPYKHVHEQAPLLSSINPRIHPELEQVILKMLNKKPADRYASCNDVIAALKKINYKDE
ncbi:MAG: protein kinase [Proteobacteria bacterium]|nr:protein kinase [Pseudomonadota bacterium]